MKCFTMPDLPIHTASLGSGSHSPVFVQVVELGPISARPEGHLKVKVAPSTDKAVSCKASILGTESLSAVDNSPYPQLAGKTPLYDIILSEFPKKNN